MKVRAGNRTWFSMELHYRGESDRLEIGWVSPDGEARSSEDFLPTGNRRQRYAYHPPTRRRNQVNVARSVRVWFGSITGSCETICLKVQFTVHRTISMTDGMAVGLAHP